MALGKASFYHYRDSLDQLEKSMRAEGFMTAAMLEINVNLQVFGHGLIGFHAAYGSILNRPGRAGGLGEFGIGFGRRF